MANLWRTQRPRFPRYEPDGFGRDYYIKYTNGGYWENQFILTKKKDYERPRYKNFHSLYHLAAPVKYFDTGSGRENYILHYNGFSHDQRPLYSYELKDFLRNDRNVKGNQKNSRKKVYLSVAESRYNKKLKDLEKKLVKRLYTEPMRKRKEYQINIENSTEINNKNSFNYDNNFTALPTPKNEDFSSTRPLNTESCDTNKNKNRIMKIKNSFGFDSNPNILQNKYKDKIRFNIIKRDTLAPIDKRTIDNTNYGHFNHSKHLNMSKTIESLSPRKNIKFSDPFGKFRDLKFEEP